MFMFKKCLQTNLRIFALYIKNSENAEIIRKSSAVQTPKSGLLEGLLQHYEPSRTGPDTNEFVPQERILSKWSSMLYTR